MNIFIIVVLSLIALTLGIIGYLEKIAGKKLRHINYTVLLIIFIIVSAFSLYKQIASSFQISELEQRTNTINAIELRVTIDATTPIQSTGEDEVSVGWSSIVAIFDKENIRYRFATDYEYSIQQVTENTSRLVLLYKPEDQTQFYGKPIDFLEIMDVFVFDYSSFFKSIGFDPGVENNIINMKIFINGVDILVIDKSVASPGLLSSGQLVISVNKVLANISDYYTNKIKLKYKE